MIQRLNPCVLEENLIKKKISSQWQREETLLISIPSCSPSPCLGKIRNELTKRVCDFNRGDHFEPYAEFLGNIGVTIIGVITKVDYIRG